MKIRFVIVNLFLLFPFSLVYGADFQTCINCHESLQSDSRVQYVHSPFAEKMCEECHALDVDTPLSPKEKKIDWLSDGSVPSQAHVFRVADKELGEVLVLEIKGLSAPTQRHEIPVPQLHQTKSVEDHGIFPVISNPRLISLERGVFLKATIGWETNTLTNSAINYGETDLSKTKTKSKRFGRNHRHTIGNLAPNKTYRFKAISHDLFGRKCESKPVTFSTAVESVESQSNNIEGSKNIENITAQFSRVEDRYLIEVQLPQPQSIFLGTKGRKQPCLPQDEDHKGLSCIEVSFMTSCLNCHKKHDHPVGVAPKRKGIRIPKEFPALFGRQIVCVSCHSPHSSQHNHLTRKDSKKDLCASCHRGWSK